MKDYNFKSIFKYLMKLLRIKCFLSIDDLLKYILHNIF